MTPDLEAALKLVEDNAVAALKDHSDLAVAASIYQGVVKALGDYKSPEAIVYGLEAVVRAVRESARQKQISEMTVPGVQ